MSRKVINILFIVGSCLYIPGIAMIIWGYVALFHNIAQSSYYGTYSSNPLNGFGTFIGFFWGGMIMISVGSITLLVARIGALIELGKAQEWVWFTLMIIFGWVVMLLYLTVGPKSEPVPRYVGYPSPYPPGHPWAGYYPPQAPGMMPAGQPWAGYYPPQAPGTPPPAQPWPGYPPQASGTMPPAQPWPTQPPVEQQDAPEKPREE